MNRRRIGIAAVVLALAAILYWTSGFGLWDRNDDGRLLLYGNVEQRTVDLSFRVPGRIIDMPADEGDRVQAGQLLARLDVRQLTDALAAAEAQVGVAEAELARRTQGNRPQEIAQAAATVAERRAALARAAEEYERRRSLVGSGAVSQAQFEASRAEYQQAQARLRSAEQALSLQRAGSRSEDIRAAQAQRRAAQAERDRVRTDLDEAMLRAPLAATVMTRAREPGAVVQPGETVFTLAIDRPLRVRAYVPEPSLGRISPGMKVEVRADGNPRIYRGTIGFISPTAEFTPRTVQTEDLRSDLVYRLRIIVTNPDDALRQGQPVTVTVPGARPAATD